MGVHIDDAGGEHQPVAGDALLGAAVQFSDFENAAIFDRYIRRPERRARAVGNFCAFDDKIIHGNSRRSVQGASTIFTPIIESRVTSLASSSRLMPSVLAGRLGSTR